MWIVLFADNTRHSAWVTKHAAHNQQEVLKNAGYRNTYIRFDVTTQCENGYYYI